MDNGNGTQSYSSRVISRVALPITMVAAVAATVAVSTGTGADVQAARVIDRTYRCPVGVDGGIRSVSVSAQTGVRDLENRTRWTTPPHVQLNPASGSAVRVWAGRAVTEPSATNWTETFYAVGCARTSASVSLSRTGIDGGRASQLGDRYQCPAPRTVLVRVRIELVRPASVAQRTSVPVRMGLLAVRTVTGKRIAYADVHESGRARIFAAPSCVPE
jgi:hypothetical protein